MVCAHFSSFISSVNNVRGLNVLRLATFFPFRSSTFECSFDCHKQQLCSLRAHHEKSFDSEDGREAIVSIRCQR